MSQNHSFGDLLKWSLSFIMTLQNNYSRLKQNKTNNKEMKKRGISPKHTVSQRDFPAPGSENEKLTIFKSGMAFRIDHKPITV